MINILTQLSAVFDARNFAATLNRFPKDGKLRFFVGPDKIAENGLPQGV